MDVPNITDEMPIVPGHPLWEEFVERLEGPEGCDFQERDGKTVWRCSGKDDRTYSRTILAAMGLTPEAVVATLAYFDQHGGYCDCEVLFNVNTE
jgi:hypothetical protein